MGRWRPPQGPTTALITREGFERLKAELEELWRVRRPEVVKALAAAAAEGDRSENAEYTYRKKQLGDIEEQPAETGETDSRADRHQGDPDGVGEDQRAGDPGAPGR